MSSLRGLRATQPRRKTGNRPGAVSNSYRFTRFTRSVPEGYRVRACVSHRSPQYTLNINCVKCVKWGGKGLALPRFSFYTPGVKWCKGFTL